MDELELLRKRVQQLEIQLAEARLLLSGELYPLRARLTPLKGFVRTLLDDENEEWYTRENRREFYTIIDENVEHLQRHLNTLREMADIQAGRFVMYWQDAVDIYQFIQSLIAVHQAHAKNRLVTLHFDLDFKPESILIETDPDRFYTILNYLLLNAANHSETGSVIWVRARLEPPNEVRSFETLLLQVEDHGIGLSKAELSRVGKIIGDKEERKPKVPDYPDVVLRLITFLAEAHQGELWFESEGQSIKTIANLRIPVKQPKE